MVDLESQCFARQTVALRVNYRRYMTLDAIGWEHAPLLLRVCVRYLANEIVPPKGPDVEALKQQVRQRERVYL